MKFQKDAVDREENMIPENKNTHTIEIEDELLISEELEDIPDKKENSKDKKPQTIHIEKDKASHEMSQKQSVESVQEKFL